MVENNIKLSLHIENSEPLNLTNLANGLNSFSKLYSNFTRNTNATLLVSDVKKGCCIFELISTNISSILPLLSDVNNIIQFCEYFKLIKLIVTGSSSNEIEETITNNYLEKPTLQDFKSFKDIANISGDNNTKITVETININNNQTYNNCTLYSSELPLINKNINNLINNNEVKTMYTKQLFKWVQTNFNNYKSGNKALITNIYNEPLRVTFENQNIQNEMITSVDDTQWQNKYYLVDVEVLYDENKPKMYKILKNYPDESYPIYD